MAADWSDSENDLIVADYFAMLQDELAGRSVNKTWHRLALQKSLPSRSEGSIEFKHQNISAVLLGMGQPRIAGYKPASQFQGSLVDAVFRRLEAHPGWFSRQRETGPLAARDLESLWIGPPPTHSNAPPPVDVERMALIARKYDVAERDARNRALGKAGEERVMEHERATLAAAGRDDLVQRIRWTSVEDGDGAGYDISSFEPDGRPRLVEVKTTNGWERTPFHMTRTEVAAADTYREDWILIRLWDFARKPQAFSIRPPLDAHVALTPTSFLAALR